MKKVSFSSKVENDKIVKNIPTLNKVVKEFNGLDIRITFEKLRKVRSPRQNRYYRGVIVTLIQSALEDNWGEKYTNEEVHSFLKARFNYDEYYNEDTGEVVQIGKSTTKNNTEEMEVYHKRCRQFALEWFNVIIPLPNEQMEIKV